MSRFIPNTDKIGNDICLSPLAIKVPLIIADNGHDCFWFPEVMDLSSAQRMTFAMMYGLETELHRVDVSLIVPSASDVRSVNRSLELLHADPIRLKLKAKKSKR